MAATLTRTPAPVVDFDTRLTLAAVAMDVRLEHAQLAFEVNTAHLPDAATDDLVAPILPALEPQTPPTASPLAAVYLGAIQVIRERGWTRGSLRDEQGAVCAVQAIRLAATTAGQADDACAHLLDIIQQQFAAETVPAWNDQQTGPGPVIRILGAAANHAADRTL